MTDIEFVQNLLPAHYTVGPFKPDFTGKYEVSRCKAAPNEGIKDEGEWEEFKRQLKSGFGTRLKEINHTVCTYHQDFDIWLKLEEQTA